MSQLSIAIHSWFGISIPNAIPLIYGLSAQIMSSLMSIKIISISMLMFAIGSIASYIIHLIFFRALTFNIRKQRYFISYIVFGLSMLLTTLISSEASIYLIMIRFIQGFLCANIVLDNYFIISHHYPKMQLSHFVKTLCTKYALIGYIVSFILTHIFIKHASWQLMYTALAMPTIIYGIYGMLYVNNKYIDTVSSDIKPKKITKLFIIYSTIYGLISSLYASIQIVIPIFIIRFFQNNTFEYMIFGKKYKYTYPFIAATIMLISLISTQFSEKLHNHWLIFLITMIGCELMILYNIPCVILSVIAILLFGISIGTINNIMDNISYNIACQATMHIQPVLINISAIISGIILEYISYDLHNTFYFGLRIVMIAALYGIYLMINNHHKSEGQ